MGKLFFLLPLALCLVFQPHYTAAEEGAFQKASKESLIQTACAASSSQPLCSSTLSAVANNPYLDPIDITITAVQAATKTAVATFDIINMSLTVDVKISADPAVRQSLTVCANAYKNVIETMDKASTSLTQKDDTAQVPVYLNTAIGSVARCDASGIKTTNRVVQIAAKNIDCTKLIKNALDIYQVFATYITNPGHDPKKGPAPIPNVGGGANAGASGGGVAGAAANGGGVAGGAANGGGVAGVFKGGIAGGLGGRIVGAQGVGGNVAGASQSAGGIAGALKGGSAGPPVSGGVSGGSSASAVGGSN